MSVLELLRFNWKPSVLRLGLAALADAGPVARRVWVTRAGLPANHFAAALREARRLGLLAVEIRPEGLNLLVQPLEFWQERPLWSAEDFAQAWQGATMEQRRMALVTEEPGLAEAMSRIPVVVPDSGRESYRIPVIVPESGRESYRIPVPVTSIRKDVLEKERLTSKRRGVPESGSEAGDGLRARVRAFVGERDWRKFWQHDEWQAIFEDAPRAAVLAGSLSYLQAGLLLGMTIRKPGAALWEDYKRSLGKVLSKV